MADNTYERGEHGDGSYVVKKTKKSSVIAFIICLLIAFVIWAYTASYGADSPSDTENTNPPSVENTAAGNAK